MPLYQTLPLTPRNLLSEFRKFFAVFSLFLGIFCSAENAALAADCGGCAIKTKSLETETTAHENYQALLRKNKEYMDRHGSRNPSSAVKVRSNMLIIALRIEASKNNIEALKSELESKGCAQCQKANAR